MLEKRMRSPAALSTLGLFSTVPIGFNRSPLSSETKMITAEFISDHFSSCIADIGTYFPLKTNAIVNNVNYVALYCRNVSKTNSNHSINHSHVLMWKSHNVEEALNMSGFFCFVCFF